VETFSLCSVELLQDLDLRKQSRLTVVDVLIPKLTPEMLDVLQLVKAPENLSLYLRSQSLHAALPTSKVVKALLDTSKNISN
jgi:hypothetical protein